MARFYRKLKHCVTSSAKPSFLTEPSSPADLFGLFPQQPSLQQLNLGLEVVFVDGLLNRVDVAAR
jgi:hypothetical protein